MNEGSGEGKVEVDSWGLSARLPGIIEMVGEDETGLSARAKRQLP